MQSFPSSTPSSLTVKADAGQRFVAYLIDFLIAAVPIYVIAFLISPSLLIIGQIWFLAYLLTRDTLPLFGGRSIGKKVMNIKTVKEGTGASIVGDYVTGAIRQIPLIIPLFNLVDALMVVFDSEKKRFGDKWAKTIVVKS